MSDREFRRKVRSGPVGRWWIQDDLHYVNVPGGVLAKIFDVRWGEHQDSSPAVTSSLQFIPGIVLMVRIEDKTLPEDHEYPAEDITEIDAKFFDIDDVDDMKGEGWKVFR